MVAAVVALAWANSPWSASYRALWDTLDLRHWVDEGLMTVFFLVVALEIKHELVRGALRDRRTAALPAVAALGGMVVPAALFVLVAGRTAGARGWGIPMATDIAFALGVVALVGRRVPRGARLFLLTLAVVDDMGAIVVIAVFYSSGIDAGYLLLATALVALIAVLLRVAALRWWAFAALGAGLWLATYLAGVHATIAGVVLGLLTPARGDRAPAERLRHLLEPWSTFAVLPLFALANAGVTVRSGLFDAPGAAAAAAGVVLGLVAGKTVGITGAVWLAARSGLVPLPDGATWPVMVATAAVCGVGFTVSLFVAGLAFGPGPVQDASRLGVLAGSTVAGVLGGVSLRWASRPRDRSPQ